MAIRNGQSLLHYRVVGKVGAGGMGEVYRAEDTRLGRDVALKLLPEELRSDPQRLARLEREARALAALNHPHVATVHGLEEAADGTRFLVMELIEGESLAQRLSKGALPLEQVFDLGAQIAEALGAAHARGIVHRDLKPANVMLTAKGIKLLDFGLARTVEPPSPVGTHVATKTLGSEPLTGEGALLGTFQYMSPEQLEGDEADARSDVFALGAVLYEMATGARAFHGKSTASLIAAILSGERPSIASRQPLVPAALDRLVKTCLARDPDERWQSARDVRLELQWIAEEAAAPGPGRAAPRRRGREIAAWSLAALALVAAAFFALRPSGRETRPVHLTRFTLRADAAASYSRVSPDGRLVSTSAYSGGQRQIWLRPLDEITARPLAGTENARWHCWSPDSRYIAFISKGKLRKLDVSGGLPQVLCDAPGGGPSQFGSWGRDGTIVFGIGEAPGHDDGLYRVSADGGTPERITFHDDAGNEIPLAWPGFPSFLPDGRLLFMCEWPPQGGTCVAELDSGRTRKVLDVLSYAEYAPPGYLLYTRSGVLVAQRFDLATLSVRDEPVPLVEGVAQWGPIGMASFSVSGNGVLVHDPARVQSRLVWRDRGGAEIAEVGSPADYKTIDLSRDGSKVATTIEDPRTGSAGVWTIELARNVSTRFTLREDQDAISAVWSPDGGSLAFALSQDSTPNVHVASLDDGTPHELVPPQDTLHWPTDWSPDGKLLLYGNRDPTTDWDLWVVPLAGDREPTPFLRTPFVEMGGRFSPDGRWVAYESNESGRPEVYVQPLRGAGAKRRVSTAGGVNPRWPRDAGELFYLSADNDVMAVSATAGASLELGAPVRLFHIEPGAGVYTDYDVTADGQRFLVKSGVPGAVAAPTVVVNWTAELER